MIRISELIAPVYYPVHEDLKRQGHAEYWLKGGRGSAKSSFISIEIVLGMLRDPTVNAIVYRKVANTLRDSVAEQLMWAAAQLGVDEYFRCRLSPLEMVYLPTGQKILFRGADDPGKSKSIKLAKGRFGYLWFEELTEFAGMEDIRTIKQSILRGTDHAAVLYSYNPPKSARNWVNEEALVPRADRLVHESSYLDLPPEWLGEAFLNEAEQLRRTNERAYRHAYLGEVTGTGGQVFENLSLRPLTEEERSGGRVYNGLDFGFAVDPDAFIRVSYDKRLRKLCVLDEFRSVRTPVERLAEEVGRRAGKEVVWCDSADPRMISQLRERGLQTVGVKKGPNSVMSGVRWLQELAEIAIDPRQCPWAAKEFSGYEYLQSPSGEFLPEYPDRDNHLIDACRYALAQAGASAAQVRTEAKLPWQAREKV